MIWASSGSLPELSALVSPFKINQVVIATKIAMKRTALSRGSLKSV